MIYFVVRVLVYSLAAAGVMSLVPGLSFELTPWLATPHGVWVSFLVVGIVFGAIQAVGRPVLLFLSGRLYIWSLGLVSVAINGLLFLALALSDPTPWNVPAGRLLSALLGTLLMGVLVTLLEAVTGLDSPRAEVGSRITPWYWGWLSHFPGRGRNRAVESLRTVQLITTVRSYAIDIVADRTLLAPIRDFMKRLLYRVRPRLGKEPAAVKVRLMLQELGPTFVKFGQLVASRAEVMPPGWRLELEQLQDNVRAFPFSEAEQVIENELDEPLEQAFRSFEREPLAAASTGQVHAATLPDGTAVVVKVQRPKIDTVVKGDLNILRDLLEMLVSRFAFFRRFGLMPLFNEFAISMLQELDYTNEAYQARMLRHNLAEFDFVEVPAIYPLYSTRRLLTMQRVSGVKITDVASLDQAGVNRHQLGLRFFKVLMKQVLFDGFFHADLHGGNVWYDLEQGKLVFLDLGLVGQLSRTDRVRFGQLIWALHDRAAGPATQVLLALSESPRARVDTARLQRDVERLLNRHLLLASAAPDIAALFNELVALLVRYGLNLRGEFTLAFKTIAQGEAIMAALMGDEQADTVVDIAFRTMRDMVLKELNPLTFGPEVALPLARDAMARLPSLLGAAATLIDDFEHGRSALQLDVDSFERRLQQVNHSFERGFRRMVLSISLVGLLLGSALMLLAPLGDIVSGTESFIIRLVAAVGVTTSAFITISIVVMMLMPRGRPKWPQDP